MKKISLPKDELYHLYINERKTAEQIAKQFKCSKDVVLVQLREYAIPVRHSGRNLLDITGQIINNIKVIKLIPDNKKYPKWLCECHCKETFAATYSELKRGRYGCWECRNEFISLSKRKGYKEISGDFWDRTKRSAKVRNLEFNISIEDVWNLFLQQNRKCALTGIDIKFNPRKSKLKEATASLDRIDSSKGYIIDNVQWVHKVINNLKMDLDEQEFIDWCNKVSEYRGKNATTKT